MPKENALIIDNDTRHVISGYAIAICTLGKVVSDMAISLATQVFPLGTKCRYIQMKGLTTVNARNLAVQQAMEVGDEVLVFWDDDVVPQSNQAVSYLIHALNQNPEIDLVGGVYPRRAPLPEPIVLEEHPGVSWWGWQDGGIHKVYMTGTGFLAIRLSSLKKLKVEEYDLTFGEVATITVKRYFDHTTGENGEVTDDFYLAKLAEEAGLNWYVHGKVICDQMDERNVWSVDKARMNVAPIEKKAKKKKRKKRVKVG